MPAGGLSCGAGVAVCCAGEAQVLLAPVGAADDLRQNNEEDVPDTPTGPRADRGGG